MWVVLEVGLFLVSEDLALSIRCPLAVEREALEVEGLSGGRWEVENFTGTDEQRARRGRSMPVGEVGEGVGGGEVRQIHGGDGESSVEVSKAGFEHKHYTQQQLFQII